MTRYWIGVASRDHVEIGTEGHFAQLCHGKERPLRRMQRGDWLIYYSPRTKRRGGETVQAFTGIGRVSDDEISQQTMSDTFAPFRRSIAYVPCHKAPIRSLIDRLACIRDTTRWGMPFRAGHLEISEADFRLIATAMRVDPDEGAGAPRE